MKKHVTNVKIKIFFKSLDVVLLSLLKTKNVENYLNNATTFDLFEGGYLHFANVTKTKLGNELLELDGYTYRRDSVGKDSTKYWRCICYTKTACRARVSTRLIKGYEMVKVPHQKHNHGPDDSSDMN